MVYLAPIPAFDLDLAEAVVRRVACGGRLTTIDREPGMPTRETLALWLLDHAEFRGRIAQAQLIGLEFLADENLDIADGVDAEPDSRPPNPGEVNARNRGKIGARQWIMACRNPEKYGRAARAPRKAAKAAAEAAPSEAAPAKPVVDEAALKAAAEKAWETSEMVNLAAYRSKAAGNHKTEMLEVDGCLIPCDRYVCADDIHDNTNAHSADFCARVMAAKYRLGVMPGPEEFTVGAYDADLFAALIAKREEGAPPIELPHGPLPSPRMDEALRICARAKQNACDDEYDDDEDAYVDPRFAAFEAATSGPPNLAPAPVPTLWLEVPCEPPPYPFEIDPLIDYGIDADLKRWDSS